MRALLLLPLLALSAPMSAAVPPPPPPPGFPAALSTPENIELLWDWQTLVSVRWYAQMEHWCYATDRIPPAPGSQDARAARQREQLVELFGEAPLALYERYGVVALDCRKVRDEGHYRRSYARLLDRTDARLAARRARKAAN